MQILPSKNSESWISIGILRPRKLASLSSSSQDDLVASVSSISQSFHSAGLILRSAVLRGRHDSNLVAVYSIWGMSTGSVDLNTLPKAKHARKVLNDIRASLSKQPQRPPSLPTWQIDAYSNALRAAAKIIDMSWYEVSCWDSKDPSLSAPERGYESSSIPSPLKSPVTRERGILAEQPFLLLGDIVHLRSVVGRLPDSEEMLSYSCLAILKSYFHTMDGLSSYSFYKSLDGAKMTGLGIWQDTNEASAFLNASDGAPEESYWRSMGAKTKVGMYQVAFMTDDC